MPALDSDPVISTMRRGGIFDADVVAEAELHIRPGSTVLDLGSNFGQMAVLFSRMTGPTGVVHAFEADPFICQALRKNVEANGAKNVIVHEAAVWHMDGRSLFYPEQDLVRFGALGSYGIDPNATKGRTVPSITINSPQPACRYQLHEDRRSGKRPVCHDGSGKNDFAEPNADLVRVRISLCRTTLERRLPTTKR